MIIFTGSFDPPTFGHLSIIKRAAKLLGPLTVVVCDNLNKKHLFDQDERVGLMTEMVKDIPKVKVTMLPSGQMLSKFIIAKKVKVLVRGLRNGIDLEYERGIEEFVKEYGVDDVMYLLNEPELANISSSGVRNHINVMIADKRASEIILKFMPKDTAKYLTGIIKRRAGFSFDDSWLHQEG